MSDMSKMTEYINRVYHVAGFFKNGGVTKSELINKCFRANLKTRLDVTDPTRKDRAMNADSEVNYDDFVEELKETFLKICTNKIENCNNLIIKHQKAKNLRLE